MLLSNLRKLLKSESKEAVFRRAPFVDTFGMEEVLSVRFQLYFELYF